MKPADDDAVDARAMRPPGDRDARGAEGAVDELREDASVEILHAAEQAAELAREAWRQLAEFQLNAALAFEALFIRLRRAFAGIAAPA